MGVKWLRNPSLSSRPLVPGYSGRNSSAKFLSYSNQSKFLLEHFGGAEPSLGGPSAQFALMVVIPGTMNSSAARSSSSTMNS
eukprot:2120271-Rhodomonas_salina.1